MAYADRHGYGDWKALALLHEGIATAMLGRFDDGLVLIRRYQSYNGLQRALYAALSRGFEAQVCLWAGKTDEARKALDAAFGAAKRYNERHWDAELHRLHGELLLTENHDNAAGAETCLRKALEVSGAQQARSLELRAATSLARLWKEQGRMQDAASLLGPIYAGFTEGFDTRRCCEPWQDSTGHRCRRVPRSLGGVCSRVQRPRNFAGRFSTNALMPSSASAVEAARTSACASSSS